MTRDEREQQEAIEAHRRKKVTRQAYWRAISAGGPLAAALTEPEPLPPGSVGDNAPRERRDRERRRPRRDGLRPLE